MKKTITIGDRVLPLEWRGGTAILYKREFKEDPIQAVMKLMGSDGELDIASLDFEFLYRVLWLSARVADNTINEDFLEFLNEFDEIPMAAIALDIAMLLLSSIQSTVESKNKQAPQKKK